MNLRFGLLVSVAVTELLARRRSSGGRAAGAFPLIIDTPPRPEYIVRSKKGRNLLLISVSAAISFINSTI